MLTLAQWAGGGRGFTTGTTLGLGAGRVLTFRVGAGGDNVDLQDPNLPMFRTAGQWQYVLINLSAVGALTVRTPGPTTLLTVDPDQCAVIILTEQADGTREWHGGVFDRAT